MFAARCVNQTGGAVLVKPAVPRDKPLAMIAQLPPCTIAMEACSGAHECGRQFQQHGLQVKLMAPKRAGHVIARSTLAKWVGECGAQLQSLIQALADELRRHAVLHANETPVAMLKPGKGKTHRAVSGKPTA